MAFVEKKLVPRALMLNAVQKMENGKLSRFSGDSSSSDHEIVEVV